jgi:hypothetical protein
MATQDCTSSQLEAIAGNWQKRYENSNSRPTSMLGITMEKASFRKPVCLGPGSLSSYFANTEPI